MRPGLVALAAAGATAAACLTAAPAGAATYPAGFEERTIVGGLDQPVSMAWAPDGRLFIIEKPGRLKVVAPGATQATTILNISGRVNSFHDRGLLGLALDSNFASNGLLYLSYTYDIQPMVGDSDAPMVSRVGRYTISANNVVSPEQVVLGSHVAGPCPPPSNTLDCMPSNGLSHSIGTVLSAPDGTLWIGNGDAADFNIVDPLAFRTYDERSMAGKILHVDRDGRGLPGHPFCPGDADLTHVCTKIHSQGFRNPFRFKLRPNGSLTVADVGWGQREEVNLIAAGGRSYGWPCYEGTIRTGGYGDRPECVPEYAKEGTAAAHLGPQHDYQHTASGNAVMAGPEYTAVEYPAAYRGDIFFADYAAGFISRLKLGASGQVASVEAFATDWVGVDLAATPNGDLAFPDFQGAIKRVVYTPSNRSPSAVLNATPTRGPAPLPVQFDAAGSSDPNGDPLSYDWDFGDGTPHSSVRNPAHTYTQRGVYSARLTVSDGRGLSDTETVSIAVGLDPPTASITSPANGSLYRDGQTIQLRGTATDTEDGQLPASAYRWTVRLHHGGHIHLVNTYTGVVAPSFTALNDHDADSYYNIELQVTDSHGLGGSHSIELRPRRLASRSRARHPERPSATAASRASAPCSGRRRSATARPSRPLTASSRVAGSGSSTVGRTGVPGSTTLRSRRAPSPSPLSTGASAARAPGVPPILRCRAPGATSWRPGCESPPPRGARR